MTLSPFLIKLTTEHSVAPVPEAERQTASPSVSNIFFVLFTHSSYSSTKSSLL